MSTATKAAAKPRHKLRGGSDLRTGYLLLAPWLFGFVFMYLVPAVMSIYYSFTNYNLLSASDWVGLDNYIQIFTQDQNFRQAMSVTFRYVFIMVPLRLAFALFVATLLNKKHMGMAFYRVLYYIPSIVGGSIAVSVVWKQIFGNKGVLMSLLEVFGIEQKFSLLGNPDTALFVIILMGVWQFGSCMLVFLPGLKQITQSLYESASMDGASRFTQFWKITMPMLTPTIFFNLIQQIINGFRVFTESYVITDGGPMNSTLTFLFALYHGQKSRVPNTGTKNFPLTYYYNLNRAKWPETEAGNKKSSKSFSRLTAFAGRRWAAGIQFLRLVRRIVKPKLELTVN